MTPLTVERVCSLTVQELRSLTHGKLEIPRSHREQKATFAGYIISNATSELLESVEYAVLGKEREVEERARNRKRKLADDKASRRKKARVEAGFADPDKTRDVDKFLQLPSEERVRECYHQFYEATSNASLEMAICAVCAREVNKKCDRVSIRDLTELPNSHRLIPAVPHPVQNLYNGRLLEPKGIEGVNEEGGVRVKICGDCMGALCQKADKPPALSLANNLWIGPVPWHLEVLTFPEQMLIALLYPRVFVFKLFPKDADFRPGEDTLQRGMRGTVSTFEMDVAGVSGMTQGNLMPRPPSILPLVISVTFIGRGQVPKRKLRSIFRVRRRFIFEALCWLKYNNPKYYGDIVIDGSRIQSLPDDDVPDEILGIMRQNTDEGLVEQESAGYVPNDDVDGE